MLVQLSTKNFRSIKENMTLNLIPLKDNHLSDTNVLLTGSKRTPQILRSAAVLGSTASGKSNLLSALGFMRDLVIQSTAFVSLNQVYSKMQPFRLGASDAVDPTEFEVAVVINDATYQYGFSILDKRVVDEYLYVSKTAKAQTWFTRVYDRENDQDVYTFGSHLKGQLQFLSRCTSSKELFLAVAAEKEVEMLQPLVNWFVNDLVIVTSTDVMHEKTVAMLDDEEGRRQVAQFLRNSDIRVSDIEIQKLPDDQMKIDLLYRINGKEARFDLAEEGAGARKIICLAGPIIYALKNSKVLVVDDFDVGLHPILVHEYIKAFRNPDDGSSGGQLIITTTRSGIIDPHLLRRDQIWFMDRKHGASSMASLGDFSVRKDADNEKGYLQGRFGGVPFLRQTGFMSV